MIKSCQYCNKYGVCYLRISVEDFTQFLKADGLRAIYSNIGFACTQFAERRSGQLKDGGSDLASFNSPDHSL